MEMGGDVKFPWRLLCVPGAGGLDLKYLRWQASTFKSIQSLLFPKDSNVQSKLAEFSEYTMQKIPS